MTDQKLLIGSLSNDLMRVATLTQRGSLKAAAKFLDQAKKWCYELSTFKLKGYLQNIVDEIKNDHPNSLTTKQAEKYLMYSILLQNYSLKMN